MKRIIVAGIICCLSWLLYLACVNSLEAYEVAITRNLFTGEVKLQDHGGYHLRVPWVQVARIDTRPARVCITSATRAFNCKLVQFEPSAYKEFVAVQGFRYYWWANRFSFNSGYAEEYRGMRDILRGYAYGVKQYPFVTILRDYVEDQ